jgi:hypothetical protein
MTNRSFWRSNGRPSRQTVALKIKNRIIQGMICMTSMAFPNGKSRETEIFADSEDNSPGESDTPTIENLVDRKFGKFAPFTSLWSTITQPPLLTAERRSPSALEPFGSSAGRLQ